MLSKEPPCPGLSRASTSLGRHGCKQRRGWPGQTRPSGISADGSRAAMTSVPERMRHIAMEAPGGPEMLRLATGPMPHPAAGEGLIRVAAAGVNRPDILQRTGNYPPPPGASPILGLEVSGTIAALGPDVTEWRQGAEICALVAGGGYAEYCIAPAPQCLPVPAGISLIDA